MSKNNTTVVEKSSGAGWFIAIIILIALGFGGWYLYNNMESSNDASLDINVNLPSGQSN